MTDEENKQGILEVKKKDKVMRNWKIPVFVSFLYFGSDPRILANPLMEYKLEMDLDEIDDTTCIIWSYRMVKERKANQKITNELKKLYGGCCQICNKSFEDKYGNHVIEGHHIEYFSKSQNNDMNNTMLLCPNHNRIVHKLDPKFNRNTLSFVYKNGFVETLQLNKHLK